VGRGDRTSFYNYLIDTSVAEVSNIIDLAGKLHYFATGEAFGKSIYKDQKV